MTTPNTETQKLSDDRRAAEAHAAKHGGPDGSISGWEVEAFLAGIAHARQQLAPGEEEIATLKAELERAKEMLGKYRAQTAESLPILENAVTKRDTLNADNARLVEALGRIEAYDPKKGMVKLMPERAIAEIHAIARAALKGEKEPAHGK